MPISTITEERRQRLQNWEGAVSNMASFEIPEDFGIKSENKYERFMGYLKEWTFRLLTNTSSDNYKYQYDKSKDQDVNDLFFAQFNFDVKEDKKDAWWKNAIMVGSGKKVANDLTKLENPNDLNNRNTVYQVFLPAYRALKDSFEKRSVFQWIFNHSQYVAERDSLKALTGIITSLTGGTKADLDSMLRKNRAEIPTSNKEELENLLKSNEISKDKVFEKERIEVKEIKEMPYLEKVALDLLEDEPDEEKSLNDSFEIGK